MFALSSLPLAAHALRSPLSLKTGRICRSWVSELKSACVQKWKMVPMGTGGQCSSPSSASLSNNPASTRQTRRHARPPLLSSSPAGMQMTVTLLGTAQENQSQCAAAQTSKRKYPELNPHPLKPQALPAHANLTLPAVVLHSVQAQCWTSEANVFPECQRRTFLSATDLKKSPRHRR